MKTALLAVLITTVCYDRVQAQAITPQVINVTENALPNKNISSTLRNKTAAIADGAIITSKISDGTTTSDKLANDLIITNRLIDGAATSNKLADDLINSLKIVEVAMEADGEKVKVLPVMQQLHKPRPINSKRKGRLQL